MLNDIKHENNPENEKIPDPTYSNIGDAFTYTYMAALA